MPKVYRRPAPEWTQLLANDVCDAFGVLRITVMQARPLRSKAGDYDRAAAGGPVITLYGHDIEPTGGGERDFGGRWWRRVVLHELAHYLHECWHSDWPAHADHGVEFQRILAGLEHKYQDGRVKPHSRLGAAGCDGGSARLYQKRYPRRKVFRCKRDWSDGRDDD